jgi:hypothetical protein
VDRKYIIHVYAKTVTKLNSRVLVNKEQKWQTKCSSFGWVLCGGTYPPVRVIDLTAHIFIDLFILNLMAFLDSLVQCSEIICWSNVKRCS